MTDIQKTISPVDGSVYAQINLATGVDINNTLNRARVAQQLWRFVPLAERIQILSKFVDIFVGQSDEFAAEITWQMGRPISQAGGEIRGFEERARYMISIAEEALASKFPPPKEGLKRFIRREPLGVVLSIAAWNYPYLIAVNSVVPALLAGNAVILKHSAQTPLCADRFAQCLTAAGFPDGVFQALHASHADTEKVIQDSRIDYVAFTGSVNGGLAVQRAANNRFIGVGLELGGNDPSYVCEDANIEHAIESLVDGAFFNSGQSCCGIGRVYVAESLYDRFVEGCVELTKTYRLGNPTDPNTNLGPLVRTAAAQSVRDVISCAVNQGARQLIDPKQFGAARENSPYMAPQILVDVDHRMPVMRDETFGPLLNIMKVKSDNQAIELMNDSPFGLTASIWTADSKRALEVGDLVNTGTWFLNRCDYLDPALAWVGVKDSGRGCTLSSVGFEHLTRPKSYNLRPA